MEKINKPLTPTQKWYQIHKEEEQRKRRERYKREVEESAAMLRAAHETETIRKKALNREYYG